MAKDTPIALVRVTASCRYFDRVAVLLAVAPDCTVTLQIDNDVYEELDTTAYRLLLPHVQNKGASAYFTCAITGLTFATLILNTKNLWVLSYYSPAHESYFIGSFQRYEQALTYVIEQYPITHYCLHHQDNYYSHMVQVND